jgi:hypothetical protein
MHSTIQPNAERVSTIEARAVPDSLGDIVVVHINEGFDGSGTDIALSTNHWQIVVDALADLDITTTPKD